MRAPAYDNTKLPRKILEELGEAIQTSNNGRKRNTRYGTRKEQRKAARVEKKKRHAPLNKHLTSRKHKSPKDVQLKRRPSLQQVQQTKAVNVQPKVPRLILRKSDSSSPVASRPEARRPQFSLSDVPARLLQRTRKPLTADDAEIEALERALGVKDKNKLPKSFEDDGLNSLLEGLDDIGSSENSHLGKRKRKEEQEWLGKKRKDTQLVDDGPNVLGNDETLSFEGFGSNGETILGDEGSRSTLDWEAGSDQAVSEDEVVQNKQSTTTTMHSVRENPYRAPMTDKSDQRPEKYIPPSLRSQSDAHSEELSRLRRQLQGLLNRLSEANLLSIVADVEKLYRLHPRQHVSNTLIDILMGLLSDSTSMQDTFIILHAGFIAALYRILGSEFGSQVIVRIDQDVKTSHQSSLDVAVTGKRVINLISLLAELYNFQVIGSGLIYDYIRVCLKDLSETNVESLLKIIRVAGQQLRQDDPSALKEIVVQLHASISRLGEKELSVRTKFMIDTINNLKNNRVKTRVATSSIASEHTVRMKKILGSMNQRSIKAVEPLRFVLEDLHQSEKKGRWSLIGASFAGPSQHDLPSDDLKQDVQDDEDDNDRSMYDTAGDLALLAKEQRMNTDVRRSIFVAIMSASDCDDAHVRIVKLRLKRSQELEIPKVLIHCAGAEKAYNPFYTLLARRTCSNRKLKMAFQFSLWDLFKQMGEKNGDEDSLDDDEDNKIDGQLELKTIVNLAKMSGTLIAWGCLSLAILKNLNLAYLRTKSRIFVEVLLITLILQSQSPKEGERNEAALVDIFVKPKEMAHMSSSLQYFLERVISTSDVPGTQHDQEVVHWGSQVASDALSALSKQSSVNG